MGSLIRLLWLGALTSTVLMSAVEKLADGVYAQFDTPRGSFTVELDIARAPMTAAHFVGLAEGRIAARDGQPYYSGLKWYRVVPGFVIQSGNPNYPEAGAAGPAFPDEFVPGLHHASAGVLSMANRGPDTNGGEFFLTLGDQTRLNYLHSVFGHVFLGREVLPKIQAGDPLSIRILRVGKAGQAFQADEATLQALAARAAKYAGADEPGPTAHFDDPAGLLPVAPPRARAFNFKLANYERATGLKIMARFFAQPPPAAEDEVAGAYMRQLAQKLGVARTGVLVAFFAPDDWRIWFGDDVVPAFLGRPVSPDDLREGGALHDAKEALVEAALKRGDEAFAAEQKAAPPGPPLPPAHHLKLQTDALLDALLLRLEPRRPSSLP